MIVAVERNRFNILYKYDQISIAASSIIDAQLEDLLSRLSNQTRFESLVRDLDRILPIFELDHEVLLLEIDKSKIGFGTDIIISFDSIAGVYPLTKEGANLLAGKLNYAIKIGSPSLEQAILSVKAERSIRLRIYCARKLLDIFSPKAHIDQKFRDTLQTTVRAIVFGNRLQAGNFIYSLLTYDKTPSYLPSGNAEFITKVGAITLVALNKDDALIRNGSLYKRCLENRDLINRGSIFDGFNNFEVLLKDSELRSSYEKIIDSINPKFNNLPIFKIAYYYVALKAYLNRNEKNLLNISNQLHIEVQKDPEVFVHVLLLIGYTFSYEELYEGIHALEQAPILKSMLKLSDYEVALRVSRSIIAVTTDTDEGPRNQTKPQVVHRVIPDHSISHLQEPSTEKESDRSSNNATDRESERTTTATLEITSLTVRDFEKWIALNAPDKKRKKWAQFIADHFPIKDALITIEDIAAAIKKKSISESDLFIKSGKNKFDGTNIINGFFKK